MPGPVERWLETFMCQQYADTFEGYGFKTLQSVSYKTTKHLQNGFLNHQCSFVKKCDINVVSFFFLGVPASATTIAGNGCCTGTC